MIRNRFLLLLALPMLALAGCSEDSTEPQTPGTNDTGAIAFEIGFAGQDTQTRVATAADFTSAFEDGDQIGIFAVESGQTLAASDNPIHNVPLTYNKTAGTWSGDALWPDGAEALDFYAYYPYSAEATDPTAMAFAVKADQSGTTDSKSNYNLSDLLAAQSDNGGAGWAKGSTVALSFSHMLAMVQFAIDEEADGIDFNEEMTVTLRGVVHKTTTFGLSSAMQPATGDAGDVTMYLAATDGTKRIYRALVPGQFVAAGTKLFRIKNGDQTLTSDALTAELSLTPANAYKFTLSGAGGGDPQTITAAPFTITAPAADAAVADATATGNDQFDVAITGWLSGDNTPFEGTTFAAGTVYKAAVTLTRKSSYYFGVEFSNNATVADFLPTNADKVEFRGSNNTLLRLWVTFPATAAPGDTPVTPVRLTIGTPVTGEPVAQITVSGNSDQYSAAIREWGKGEWFEGFQEENFLPNTYYNAIVELTPAEGYTFEGFTNTTSVLGFKPENANIIAFNSNENGVLTVRVRFPITVVPGSTPVTLPAAINGITSPAAGVAPDMTADDNGQFEVAAITWRVVGNSNVLGDIVEGTFAGDTAYAAEIKLKPKDGYRFAGLELLEKFTVNGIKNSASNGVQPDGTVVIRVDFPTTE